MYVPSVLARLFPAAVAAVALCFGASASSAKAHDTFISVHSSGTNSVVNLTDNPDGTMTLDAVQTGTLGTLGAFNGQCEYVATFDTVLQQIRLKGTGTFLLADGAAIQLDVKLTEFGLNYPIPYAGLITVTGGTGHCAGATGFLIIHGTDEEALTDGLQIDGFIWVPGANH